MCESVTSTITPFDPTQTRPNSLWYIHGARCTGKTTCAISLAKKLQSSGQINSVYVLTHPWAESTYKGIIPPERLLTGLNIETLKTILSPSAEKRLVIVDDVGGLWSKKSVSDFYTEIHRASHMSVIIIAQYDRLPQSVRTDLGYILFKQVPQKRGGDFTFQVKDCVNNSQHSYLADYPLEPLAQFAPAPEPASVGPVTQPVQSALTHLCRVLGGCFVASE